MDPKRWSRTTWALLSGVTLGVTALALGTVVRQVGAVAALAAAVTGGVVWWALVETPADVTLRRGATTGALVGILSHVAYWTLFLGYIWLSSPPGGEHAIVGLGLAFVALGLVVFGGVTAAAGAVAGTCLAYLQARYASE